MTPEPPSEPTPPTPPMSDQAQEAPAGNAGQLLEPSAPVAGVEQAVSAPADTAAPVGSAVPGPSLAGPEASQAEPAMEKKESPWQVPAWGQTALRVAEPLSVAAVFIYMLAKSWMRWPDPFIDFPRDLYIAWRVSVGDRLYDQVLTWHGPLAHLAEAAGFRVFGVGLDTVVWMNVALTTVILLLLRGIFGAIGNRFSVWLCSMTFLLVFFVGHLVDIGNYNFITPYVAQTTYGFAGLLLMLWALLGHLRSDWGWWLWLAGVGLGIAFLDKLDVLLAAAGALGVYGAARMGQRALPTTRGGGAKAAFKLAWTSAVWLATGFFFTWLPVFFYFLFKGGAAYALRATDFAPLTALPGSFMQTVGKSELYSSFIGFDAPLKNFLVQLQAAFLLLLVCGVMVAASRAWAGATRFSLWWWLGPVVVVAVGGVGAWLGESSGQWTDIGRAIVFSTILLTVVTAVWCGWAAWRGHPDFERMLGATTVGTAAILMLVRMILFGRIFHYGFFMAALAVLFVEHLVVVEGGRAGEGRQRANWLLPLVFAAVALYGGGSVAKLSLQRYAVKTYAVGSGRDLFYTFPPPPPGVKISNPQDYSASGLLLNLMLQEAKKALPKAKSILALPESAAVNFHLRIPSPGAEVELHPTGIGFAGQQRVLDDLKKNPPDGVFLYMRNMLEFNVPYFGYDEDSGKGILDWVKGNYYEVWNAYPRSQLMRMGNNIIPLTPTGDAIDLLVPGSGSPMPTPEQLMKSVGGK